MHPERLWLLVIVPIILIGYIALSLRHRSRIRAHGIDNLDRVLPKQNAWKRHIAVFAATFSLLTLNVAFAKPSAEVEVPRERATVCIAIDVSLSMEATDIEPNRLDAEKEAAVEFVDLLPPGFNAALVAFAGYGRLVVPPTTDRTIVRRAIMNLTLAPSTNIADGIYSCLDGIKLAPPDPDHPDEMPPAAIVLLSDGTSNITGRTSAEAASDAKKLNIPVHTIAYGTPNGYVTTNGRRQRVPVDKAELARVARNSGGKAFTAESKDQLQEVYSTIARDIGYTTEYQEVTERWAGYALGLAAVASLAVISLAARWP